MGIERRKRSARQNARRNALRNYTPAFPVKITKADGTVEWQQPLDPFELARVRRGQPRKS